MAGHDIKGILKKTVVLNTRQAINQERFQSAIRQANGYQVMAIEHLAGRMAGGLLRMIDIVTLREIVAMVLPDVDMGELDEIKNLPGMAQAASQSLMNFWMSGLDPVVDRTNSRIAALLALEEAVLEKMPANLKRPTELRDLALARAEYAPMIFGEVEIKNMTNLHPVWQPLIQAIVDVHKPVRAVAWNAGPRSVPDWVTANPEVRVYTEKAKTPEISVQSCANPRHEVIEAMRWLRTRLAAGVAPESLAIATNTPSYYDHLVAAAAVETDVRLHFSHGLSVIHTRKGQAAAALADILLRGISQKRVRRLVELCGRETEMLAKLPENWTKALSEDAALTTVERWKDALRNIDHAQTKAVLIPVVALLASGIDHALYIGQQILPQEACEVWERALRDGPAQALDRTIAAIKYKDDVDPLTSPCFLSAEALAAAPRAEVFLIGLNSGRWPRYDREDGLIPDHVIASEKLNPMSIHKLDEADYRSIRDTTATKIILSYARQDHEGRKCEPSELISLQERKKTDHLKKSRIAPHAMSESDRLFCRPEEYRTSPEAKQASEVIWNWMNANWTPHDGLVAPGNQRIMAALNQVQSATSLKKLLRDPIGFVWQYALGFRAPEYEDEPLLLDNRQRGNLLHGILEKAVKEIEANGGLKSATKSVIATAVRNGRRKVAIATAASQPVPPDVIWQQTLNSAEALALDVLTHELPPLDNQSVYCEVSFGKDHGVSFYEENPLFGISEVIYPGTNIRVSGRIDRADVSGDRTSVRVVDYKSGKTPKNVMDIAFMGGEEIQRPIYYAVVKSLITEAVTVEAGLLYARTGDYAPLANIQERVVELGRYLNIAQENLMNGHAVPGPGTNEKFNKLLFAMPANANATYTNRMALLAAERLPEIAALWSAE